VSTTTAQIGVNMVSGSTDAIAAAVVKADAVTKIQNGLATPTNITAGVITTVTNLTNAPTNGDLTATMKISVTTAATAATPTAAGLTTPNAAEKAVVDAIKAKTDNLPASPAAVGSAMTLTSAYDAAKTAADQTTADDIFTAVLDVPTTSAATNDNSATTTSFVTNLSSTVTDFYKDAALVFKNGVLTNQSRKISAYNGSTKAITLATALTSAPANGSGFVILGRIE
jgi:hypothetical protein